MVIVSMACSAVAEAPRGMEFLLSRNRINVAVSRGQWRAVDCPRAGADQLPPHASRGHGTAGRLHRPVPAVGGFLSFARQPAGHAHFLDSPSGHNGTRRLFRTKAGPVAAGLVRARKPSASRSASSSTVPKFAGSCANRPRNRPETPSSAGQQAGLGRAAVDDRQPLARRRRRAGPGAGGRRRTRTRRRRARPRRWPRPVRRPPPGGRRGPSRRRRPTRSGGTRSPRRRRAARASAPPRTAAGVSPASSAARTLRATMASSSPKCRRRSAWPISTSRTPSSASMDGATSPVHGPVRPAAVLRTEQQRRTRQEPAAAGRTGKDGMTNGTTRPAARAGRVSTSCRSRSSQSRLSR